MGPVFKVARNGALRAQIRTNIGATSSESCGEADLEPARGPENRLLRKFRSRRHRFSSESEAGVNEF